MKKVLFYISILFFGFSFGQNNQRIENLKTDKEILDFVILQIENKYPSEWKVITELKTSTFNNETFESYYKADFNSDNQLDLLLNTSDYKSFIILSDNHNYKFIELNTCFVENCYSKVIDDNSQPKIKVVRELIKENFESSISEDTFYKEVENKILVIDNNKLYEYPRFEKKLNIKSIQFKVNSCYGSCPVFNLILNKNNTSLFIAEVNNLEETTLKSDIFRVNEGYYQHIFSDYEWNLLENEFSKIKFNSNEIQIVQAGFDQASAELIIELSNGENIFLYDYGLCLDYNLVSLYEYLFGLRTEINWQPIKEN